MQGRGMKRRRISTPSFLRGREDTRSRFHFSARSAVIWKAADGGGEGCADRVINARASLLSFLPD